MLVRMMRKHTRVFLLTASVVSLSLAAVTPCQAGPLWDWLFGPRQVAYYPVTTAGSPVAVGTPTAGCNTCASPMQRTTVNYIPQTAYRSTWARVPVTYYRPVATVDPRTGCPTNSTQACTTYQWQVRRVPITVMRPVYNASSCCPTTTAYQQTPSFAAAQVMNPSCTSCATGYAATAAPQYLTAPATVPAATTVPAMPQQPADLRPSLNPSSLPSTTTQAGGSVSVNYGAATVSGSSYNNPVSQPAAKTPTLAPATGTSTQPSVLNPTNQQPNNPTGGVSYGNGTASQLTPTIRAPQVPSLPSLPATSPTTVAPKTTTTPPNDSKLLPPIPSQSTQAHDPQFNLNRVPQLLRPQVGDKTAAASILQASNVNPVAWPQTKSNATQPMKYSEPQASFSSPQPAAKPYDDSGWSTAR